MKKRILKFLGLFLLLLACSKDFEDVLIDSFEFNLTVLANDDGFIFESSETDFRVVPERVIENTEFIFSYSIENGDGYFQDEQGNTIEQEEEIILDELVWSLNYIPTSTGVHSITVTASDNKGQEKSETFIYEVDFAPFTVLLNPGANTYIINQQNDLNLTVVSETNTELYETLNVDEDISTDYTLSFTVEGGTGAFIINGEEYEPGQTVTVQEGTFEFDYLPTTLGVHTITMIATAPDGATREQSITVNVENVDFFILSTTPSNTIAIGSEIDVTLSLQSSDASNDIDYDLAFFYANDSEGIGVLNNENREPQTAGTPRDIEPGNYVYTFSSNVLGTKKLYFDVSDSNNQVKRDSILLNVTSIPFTFSGQPVGTQTGVNQAISLSLSLSTNAPEDSDISYNISFAQVQGNGALRDTEDVLIPPATAYEVTPGVFNLEYTPTTLGEHELLFTATDSFGQAIESSISILATDAQLSFTASATNSEIVLGRTNTLSVTLAELGNTGGLTYEMNYFVTGGTGTLTENDILVESSSFFETQPGTRTFEYTPNLPGNYEVNFNLRDSNGQNLEASTSFVVVNTDFTFFASEANAEIGLGQNNNINFNIAPGTTDNGTTYTMTYTSSSNGSLNIDGVSYSPGQTITVNEGAFQGIYNPTLTGSYELSFTVQDSNGVTKTDTASFNVSNSDFVLNVAATPTELLLDEDSNINIDINQVVPNPSASYELSYAVQGGSGTLSGPSGELQVGLFTNIGTGSSSWVYSPETEGSHAITFTVRDNSGEIKEKTIVITVSGRDYTFTAIASQGASNIGETVPVNLNITEIGGTGGTYDIIVASTGNGNILYNGTQYNVGEAFTVNSGASTLSYLGTSTGTHSLTITSTASYGPIKTANTSIDFSSLEYTFTAAVQNPSISVGESTLINFNISENVGNSSYEMRFALNGQNAALSQNGASRSPGSLYAVNVGNYSYVITGSEVGTVNITFTVINANGLEKTQNVSVNVVSRDFNFIATESQGNAIVGQAVGITFNITESVSGIDTYTAVYSTTGTGSLNINGNTVNPGATFNLNAGTSSGVYTGVDGGEHTINFTVLSSSGTEKVDSASITYDTNSFAFTATENNSIATLPETVGINFNITESIPGLDTYTAIFSNTNNGTLVYNGSTINPGQSFTIVAGSTSATYTPDNGADGVHELDFQVTSSSGGMTNDLATITYNSNDFSFVASPQNPTATLGETIDINFNLSETVAGLDTYTAVFSNTNNGTFNYNGTIVNAGQSFTISVGNTTGVYTPTESGTHSLDFTVTSSSGDVQNDVAAINVNSNVFTFTAIEANPTATLGETIDINFNLSETVAGLDTYTAIFSNSNNGTFVYNNQTISAGQTFTIIVGSTTGAYTPSASGSHNLDFTVTSTSGDTNNDNASISVQSNEFTFTSIEANSNANLGETVDINFNLTETVSGIDTYSVVFSNSNNGTFVYNGQNIAAGQSFVIQPGTSTAQYTANASGNHNLSFTVTSSSGDTENDSASISFEANEFTFVATASENNGSLEELININFVLNETVPGVETYIMRYTNSNTGTFVYNGQTVSPGTNFAFNAGNTTGTYTTEVSGIHDLEFFVTSSSSITENDDVSITFSPSDFEILASAPNTFNTVTDMNVDFTLNQFGGGAFVYQMSYTSTGDGTFTYNGITYAENEIFVVPVGNFNASYIETASNTGNQTLTFNVSSTAGFNRSAQVSVLFTPRTPVLTFALLNYVETNVETVSPNTGGLFEDFDETKHYTFDLRAISFTTEDNNTLQSYIMNGVEYTLGNGISVGYVVERIRRFSASGAFYNDYRYDANDNNVPVFKRNSGTVSIQVRDTNGNLSNTINVSLPNNYGFSYPTTGTTTDFFGNVITNTTTLNGLNCINTFRFNCTF